MKVPVILVSGYLGAGKTTLLRNVVEKTEKRIAIIMNEFGEIAIDSKIIKGKNVKMAELKEGCVCCSLTGEFELAIKEILEKVNPELILIETTGIAEPDAIIINLENIEGVKLDTLVTVVDAESLIKFPVLTGTGRIQVEIADVILLNKIDLVSEKEKERCKDILRKINEKAEIFECIRCNIDLNLIFGIEVERKELHKLHEHKIEYQTISYQKNKIFSKEKFYNFLNNLPNNVYRAKGFVNFKDGTYLFNFVAGRYDFEKWEESKNQIVFIGKDLEKIKEDLIKELEKI